MAQHGRDGVSLHHDWYKYFASWEGASFGLVYKTFFCFWLFKHCVLVTDGVNGHGMQDAAMKSNWMPRIDVIINK